MGYDTRYYISAKQLPGKSKRIKFTAQFFDKFEFDDFPADAYAPDTVWIEHDDGRFSFTDEPRKWYDFKVEMKRASKQYPDVIFVLDGEGEEAGDIWRHFYLGGKKVREWRPDVEPPALDDAMVAQLTGNKS